jgi:carboxyl-terminal processing protease
MLGSLDANGAFLSPDEVARWKNGPPSTGELSADPGLSVLKAGSSLQIVAVIDGSPADQAGIRVGDHIRRIGDALARDLSLAQARRRIEGEPGSTLDLEVMHPDDGFRREELQLVRRSRTDRGYRLTVERGTAVLSLFRIDNLSLDAISVELGDVRSRPIERLLLDLRNLVGGSPRGAARVAGLFVDVPALELRDRSGRLVESVDSPESAAPVWDGSLAVLTNGATAEGAEALVLLLREAAGVRVFGEKTFGLGAEPRLFELEGGAGLLLSSTLWKTAAGKSWHESGVEPDEEVRGDGSDYASTSADQLDKVLERLERSTTKEEAVPEAA